ncbi:MAG: RNA polymerase sigma factor [Limisphaerales bacterium]
MAESNSSLVQAARAGAPEAWDSLFKRYQLPLYVYVFELVHDRQTALDLVQETFINAARYLDSLRDDEKFGSWLFGIAHQKCLQHWRKRHVETVSLDDEEHDFPNEEAEDPRELLIHREQEQELFALLDRLPIAQRAAVLLHFVENFSLEDIARITGAQLGTVKSRLHYAKKALRRLIEEQDENAP